MLHQLLFSFGKKLANKSFHIFSPFFCKKIIPVFINFHTQTYKLKFVFCR